MDMGVFLNCANKGNTRLMYEENNWQLLLLLISDVFYRDWWKEHEILETLLVSYLFQLFISYLLVFLKMHSYDKIIFCHIWIFFTAQCSSLRWKLHTWLRPGVGFECTLHPCSNWSVYGYERTPIFGSFACMIGKESETTVLLHRSDTRMMKKSSDSVISKAR